MTLDKYTMFDLEDNKFEKEFSYDDITKNIINNCLVIINNHILYILDNDINERKILKKVYLCGCRFKIYEIKNRNIFLLLLFISIII